MEKLLSSVAITSIKNSFQLIIIAKVMASVCVNAGHHNSHVYKIKRYGYLGTYIDRETKRNIRSPRMEVEVKEKLREHYH